MVLAKLILSYSVDYYYLVFAFYCLSLHFTIKYFNVCSPDEYHIRHSDSKIKSNNKSLTSSSKYAKTVLNSNSSFPKTYFENFCM